MATRPTRSTSRPAWRAPAGSRSSADLPDNAPVVTTGQTQLADGTAVVVRDRPRPPSRQPQDRPQSRSDPIKTRIFHTNTDSFALSRTIPRVEPMTISDVCINRPVFTWVLVAIPVVLGLVSYNELGRRPVPRRRLPGLHGHDGAPRRQRRGDGDHGHQADRGHHQHRLGHRRAPVDTMEGVSIVTVQFLLSKNGERRDAGGPRQGQHDPRRPSRRHRVADHRQVRHRLDARDDDRRLRPSRLPRGDRAGPQADQGAARDGQRRRRDHAGRRPGPGDERGRRHRPARRLQPLGRRRPARRWSGRTWRSRAAGSTRGRASWSCGRWAG